MAQRDDKDETPSGDRSKDGEPREVLGGWTSLFPDLGEPSEAALATDNKPGIGEAEVSRARLPVVPQARLSFGAEPVEEFDEFDEFEELEELDQGDWLDVGDAVEAPRESVSKPGPPSLSPPPDASGGAAPGGTREKFEGSRLSHALIQDRAERPPYAPKGYDPLPEHVPLIGAVLSALAPGAGQVFNGQDERAVQYGLKFLLIRPWVESVRQAQSYGERIRTYYAPRPAAGSFWRALRYLVVFWAVIISVGICLSWLGQGLWETVQIRRHEAYQIEVADVIEQSVRTVQNARVDALTAVLEAAQEATPDSEFIMSDEERARRLYIIGHEYCRRNDFRLCHEIMGRVIALQGSSRNAFRLQAWASVRMQNSREREPMPDVGEVPTLAQFEFELEREILGLPATRMPALDDGEPGPGEP
jgi:flagellar biosynthesis regulator FlaF